MNYDDLIETKRIEKANADLAALQLAARDAVAAVGAAEADVKAASATAQQAANAGSDVGTLLELESAVETANRHLAVARRIASGASLRLEDGKVAHAHDHQQAHGAALNAAMRRLLAIRDEGMAAFARLEELKAEHREVNGAFRSIANAGRCGIPNYLERQALLDEAGKMMSEQEFRNRTSQNQHHEWDHVAGKLRWTAEG